MSDIFAGFDAVLYEESWEWLNDAYPPFAAEVEKLVKLRATPEQIRARVLHRLGQHRVELATRCENAARYLQVTNAQRR